MRISVRAKCTRIAVSIFTSIVFLGSTTGCTHHPSSLSRISVFRWDMAADANDAISREIAKKFGLKFDAISAPWSSWPDKLNAMIASGTPPDLFVGYGIMDGPTYTRWARDGILLPVSDYVSSHRNLADYLARFKDQAIVPSGNDGGAPKLYSIPVESYVDHVLMIRGDWLRELGLSPPHTIGELYDLARAMRDRYHVTPISSSPAHTSGFFWLNFLFYAYGSAWDDWVPSPDGRYIPSWIAEGSRQALEYIHRLYKDGLLDPDFPTLTDAEKMERFATGKAGIVANGNLPSFRAALAKANPNADLVVLPPPSGPKGQGMWGLNGYFSAVMIRFGLNAPARDKFLSFMDYLHSPVADELFTYGVEGVDFRRDGKTGTQVPLHLAKNGSPMPLVEAEPSSNLRYLAALEWRWMPSWDSTFKDESLAVEIGKTYSRPARFPYVILPTQSDRGQQLQDYVLAQYVKMAIGDEPVGSTWPIFVKEYLKLGGAELIKEMNEAVGER